MEVTSDKIRFDKIKNRLIVTHGKDTLEIPPILFRKMCPVLDEDQKIEDLRMQIHDIEKERLTTIFNYMHEVRKVLKNQEDAIDKLKGVKQRNLLAKWKAVVTAYEKQKNTLKEYRLVFKWLNAFKKELETRIAKLEAKRLLEDKE